MVAWMAAWSALLTADNYAIRRQALAGVSLWPGGPMSDLKAQFAGHTAAFVEVAEKSPFVVFLCGPSLDPKRGKTHGSVLRKRIQDALQSEGFEVVLGEDESIVNPDTRYIGVNVQDSELEFIATYCNSIVLVADSVGSFCELGLFSWHFSHEEGIFENIDFMLLVDQKFETPPSYLNEGPAQAVNGHGRLDFVDFENYDASHVVNRMKARRGTRTVDRRGRPRKQRS